MNDNLSKRIADARAARNTVPPEKLIRKLLRLFDLKSDGEDEFTYPAMQSTSRERIFGGQVIAQALVAADHTVDPAKRIHSLHSYFLRAGNETLPLHFRVHRDFDGRSFSNRRVVVRQDGKVIFNLTASFQKPAEGLAHQAPMPDLLPPEECGDALDSLAGMDEVSDALIAQMARPRPFISRSFRPAHRAETTAHYQWLKTIAPIGDDPLMHRAALAFASDMGLLSSSLLPHNINWTTPGLFSTSLDHAMWFHDDFRVDEWLVYVMDSDWTGGARGFNRGAIYRQDGTLVASAIQEGLLRLG